MFRSRVLGFSYIFLCWLAFFELTNPDIIGFPKYQLEWGSVLILMGCLTLFSLSLGNKQIFSVFASILIVLNVVTATQLGKLNPSADEMMQGGGPFALKYYKSIFAVSNFTYPYQSAFRYILDNYSGETCLNAPVSYGVMPEILSGMNWKKLDKVNILQGKFILAQNQRKNGWTSFTPEDVADSGAKCLMLAATINKEVVINQLLENGWKIDTILKDRNFNTQIFLLSRSEN